MNPRVAEEGPRRVVLDPFAVLAYLQDEPGGREVQALLRAAADGAASLHMTTVNVGEVAYRVERAYGAARLRDILVWLRSAPIELHAVDEELALGAAEIKARHAMTFADCIAAALARRLDAELATGDPELSPLDGHPRLLWLPSPER